MIDKKRAGELALEIAERVKVLRQLVKDGARENNIDDAAFAHDVVMLGTATVRLAEKCGVTIP